jgi:multidrug efflux pump subunit AcrB
VITAVEFGGGTGTLTPSAIVAVGGRLISVFLTMTDVPVLYRCSKISEGWPANRSSR